MRLIETLEPRRLMAFGDLVSSFGTAGVVHSEHTLTGVTESAGGKFLVSGRSSDSEQTLRRYTSTGALDTAFGSGGLVSNLPNGEQTVAIDSATEKIYVLSVGDSSVALLTRLTSSGAVDTTFGAQGTTTFAAHLTSPRVVVQSDSRVLVAGNATAGGSHPTTTVIARFRTNGSLDSSFGTGGQVRLAFALTTSSFPFSDDELTGITQTSDGKILIADLSDERNDRYEYGRLQFVAARLSSSGAIDSSYGSGGIARSTYAQGNGGRGTTAFGTDGSMVFMSSIWLLGLVERPIIARFAPSGTRTYQVQSDEGILEPDQATWLPDGRIAVLGTYSTYTTEYSQLATIDPATGGMSNVIQTFSGASSIATASDGNLLIAGLDEIDKVNPGVAGAPQPDEFVGGQTNSIAQIGLQLHLAYYDAVAHELKYAYRSEKGIWSPTVVVDATPYAGQYVSIAVKSDGMPAIAYFEGSTGSLRYATTTNRTSWTTQTIDSRGSVGLYPSLVFTPDDVPAISYYNKSRGDLRFAMKRGGSTWGFEPIDTSDDSGRYSSMEFYGGQFSVGYVDTTTDDVKYAQHHKGGHWATQFIAHAKGASAVTLNQHAFSFYDAENGDLRSATLSEGGEWDDTLVARDGGVGKYNALSVSYSRLDTEFNYFYYDKVHDRLDFSSTLLEGIATIAYGGGKFISVSTDLENPAMVYYDTALGGLKVRMGPVYTP